MNLDIEEGLIEYALAQLATQNDPAFDAIPLARTHFFTGSSPIVSPDRDTHVVFEVGEIEHEVEGLFIGVLSQYVLTPRLAADEAGNPQAPSGNFESHRAVCRAVTQNNTGGPHGRLWCPSAGNKALVNAKVSAASEFNLLAWHVMSPRTGDSNSHWNQITQIRLRLEEI